MPICRRAAAVMVAGTIAACSPATPNWTGAGATDQQIAADWTQCRAAARSATETRTGAFDTERSLGATSMGPQRLDPLEAYDRARASEVYQSAMDECMRGKGYRPTGRGGS